MPEAVAAPASPTPAAPPGDGGKQAVPPQRRQPEIVRKGDPKADAKPDAKPDPKADAKAARAEVDARGPTPIADDKPAARPAPKAPEKKPEPPKEPYWKRLVTKGPDGKEHVEEYDSEEHYANERRREKADLLRLRQKQDAYERTRKAIEGKDPVEALKQLNPDFDPKRFAYETTYADFEAAEQQKADPQGWELKQAQEKLAAFERDKAEREAAEERRKAAETAKAHQARWTRTITETLRELGADLDSPDGQDYANTVLAPDVAGIMWAARKENPEHDPDLELSPKEIAAMVTRLHGQTFERGFAKAPPERLWSGMQPHLSKMDDAGLLKQLGPELTARVVKAHLAAAQAPAAPVTEPALPAAPKPAATEHRFSDDDRRAALGMKFRSPPRAD